MNGIVKIIISGCSKTNYWYKNMVGKVMEVYEADKDHYAIRDSKNKSVKKLISKKDCEVLQR